MGYYGNGMIIAYIDILSIGVLTTTNQAGTLYINQQSAEKDTMNLVITILTSGDIDPDRADWRQAPLSETGKLSAVSCRRKLVNPRYDLILHAPLVCARETAIMIAGQESHATIVAMPELLYDDDDLCGKIFEKIRKDIGGGATLYDYHQYGRGVNIADLIESWSYRAYGAVIQKVDAAKADNVLVIGHGILVAALALRLAGDKPYYFTNEPLHACEGFRLVWVDKELAVGRGDPDESRMPEVTGIVSHHHN